MNWGWHRQKEVLKTDTSFTERAKEVREHADKAGKLEKLEKLG